MKVLAIIGVLDSFKHDLDQLLGGHEMVVAALWNLTNIQQHNTLKFPNGYVVAKSVESSENADDIKKDMTIRFGKEAIELANGQPDKCARMAIYYDIDEDKFNGSFVN